MAVNNVKQEQFLSQWALKMEVNTIYCFHLSVQIWTEVSPSC